MASNEIAQSAMILVEWEKGDISDTDMSNFLQTHLREVPNIKRGNRERMVIWKFKEAKGVAFLKSRLSDDAFWKIVTMRGLKDECDVKVSNLPPKCRTNKTIYHFFTNKNMCGIVLKSDLTVSRVNKDKDWCVLHLGNSDEALTFIEKQDKIKPMDKNKLKLCEFYQDLNMGDMEDEPATSDIQPHIIDGIQPEKLDYLKRCYRDQLKTEMKCEKIVWPKENVYKLAFHAETSHFKGEKSTWGKHVQSKFEDLMKSIVKVERKINPVVWDAVVAKCQTSESVLVKQDKTKLIVVGIKDSIELKKMLGDIDSIKPPPPKITRPMDIPDKNKLEGFKKLMLKKEGEEKHGVTLEITKGKVVISGLEQGVKDAEMWMLECLNSITVRSFQFPSPAYGQILSTPMMRDAIIGIIRIPNEEAQWDIIDNTLDVYIRGNHEPDKLHQMILGLIVDDEITREGTLSSPDVFNKQVKEVENEYDQYVKLSSKVTEKRTTVTIVCGTNYLEEVRTKLLELFDELMNAEEVILIQKHVFDYINKHSMDSLDKDIQVCIKGKDRFKIDKDNNHVTVTGCKETRRKVREVVMKRVEKVQTSWHPIEKDGVVQYFSEKRAIKFLEDLQQSYHCSIRTATKIEMKDLEMSCIVLLKDGQAVFAGSGNLSKPPMMVDAIVNPTCTTLDHSSSSAKQLLKDAGKYVKRDVDDRISKDGPIDLGKVFVTGPGQLRRCQRIIHAALIDGSTSRDYDAGIIKYAITNVLEAMSKETMKSVAMVLPTPEAVTVGLKTIQEQLKRFPVVREIYFYDINPNNVRNIKLCMDQIFHDRCYHLPVENIGLGKGHMSLGDTTHTLERTGKRVLPLPGEKQIVIEWGILAKTSADILVNPTPTAPGPSGKIFHNLKTESGIELGNECSKAFDGHSSSDGALVETMAGNLPCKKIYHIKISNKWPGSEKLAEYILKCLKSVLEDDTIESVAFPTIGTADCNYPGDKVALTFIQTVGEYMKLHMSSRLKEIKMVVFKRDKDLTQEFEKVIQKIYSRRPHRLKAVIKEAVVEQGTKQQQDKQKQPQQQQKQQKQQKLPPPPGPAIAPPGTGKFVINQQTTLELVVGNIENIQAEVLVSTTSSFPNLNGVVSAAIIKAGGQIVQTSISNAYPNGYPKQGVAEGSGGSLNCKVFFIQLKDYKQPSDVQIIYDRVKECLQQADNGNCRSLAFPTIGAGNFKYPDKNSAEKTYQAINDFFKAGPKNLTHVQVVLYPGAKPTMQTFQNVVGNYFMAKGGLGAQFGQGAQGGGGGQGGQAPAFQQIVRPVSARDRCNVTWNIEGTKTILELKYGKLESWRADVILDTTTSFPNLYGAIPSVLSKTAGPQLQQACNAVQGIVSDGDIAVTDGYKLSCRKVFHYVMPDWKRANGEMTVQKCLSDCLDKMSNLSVSTIALPAIGTGGARYDADLVASGIYSAVETFARSKPTSFYRVTIVLFQPAFQINQVFKDQLDAFKNKQLHGQAVGGAVPKKVVRFGADPSDNNGAQPAQPLKKREDFLLFQFTSDNPNNIDKAIRDIEQKVNDDSNECPVDLNDPSEIGLMEELKNKKAMAKIGKDMRVTVEVDTAKKKIYVRGIGDRVTTCHKAVLELLQTLKKVQGQGIIAQYVYKYLEWCYTESYTDNDKQSRQISVPYPKHIAFVLEEAHSKGDKEKEFKDSDDNFYIVNFNTMEEMLKDSAVKTTTVTVERKDLAAESLALPGHWSHMGDAQNIDQIVLVKTDKEYSDVQQEFTQKTVGRNVTIQEIRRIQNKSLYQLYATKKKQMQNKQQGNQPTERKLWHGGKEDSEMNIISNGFNRSYAGNTFGGKVWYGYGSYFAVKPSYADGDDYSPKYKDGSKRVFQVAVLTGNTKSVNKYYDERVAPLIPNSNADRYDSVCDDTNNPTEFVIFNDTQALPEYIIKYK